MVPSTSFPRTPLNENTACNGAPPPAGVAPNPTGRGRQGFHTWTSGWQSGLMGTPFGFVCRLNRHLCQGRARRQIQLGAGRHTRIRVAGRTPQRPRMGRHRAGGIRRGPARVQIALKIAEQRARWEAETANKVRYYGWNAESSSPSQFTPLQNGSSNGTAP